MIVDDEPDLVMLFEEFLSLIGHRVIEKAYDGEEAINKFNKMSSHPNLIILDHRMPKKNGLTTTKELLELNPKLQIIILSADSRIKEDFLQLGVADFIEKPISLSNFKKILESFDKNRLNL